MSNFGCEDLTASLAHRSRRLEPGADVWAILTDEGRTVMRREPMLTRTIERGLLPHMGLADALAHRLAHKLASEDLGADCLAAMVADAMEAGPGLVEAAAEDLVAIRDRDPACPDLLTPFLYFKGFHAIQAHRVSHWLWSNGRQHLARLMQSRMSEVFGVDFHPAAQLGRRILIDHATSVVIGETAVVEDDVSMLHEVTLGGTGKAGGDRHPKVRRGVLIGAGAKILGNIEIGEGAKVGAGSVVLSSVAPYTTVVGIPARPVGPRNSCMPALTMDQMIPGQI
jgi:serine O-acetyltransferase